MSAKAAPARLQPGGNPLCCGSRSESVLREFLNRMKRLLWAAVPGTASAQCVMCARTAAAQNEAAAGLLLQGIALLLAGPLLMGGALAYLAWRRRGPQPSG
jgi:hypothetical protein